MFQIRHTPEEATHPSIFHAIRHTTLLAGRPVELPTHRTPNKPDTLYGAEDVRNITPGATEDPADGSNRKKPKMTVC